MEVEEGDSFCHKYCGPPPVTRKGDGCPRQEVSRLMSFLNRENVIMGQDVTWFRRRGRWVLLRSQSVFSGFLVYF